MLHSVALLMICSFGCFVAIIELEAHTPLTLRGIVNTTGPAIDLEYCHTPPDAANLGPTGHSSSI